MTGKMSSVVEVEVPYRAKSSRTKMFLPGGDPIRLVRDPDVDIHLLASSSFQEPLQANLKDLVVSYVSSVGICSFLRVQTIAEPSQ